MLPEVAPRSGQVLFDELKWKRIVAGRDRGVRREDRRALHFLERVVERTALLDHLADALQRDERGVAFVEVAHGRRDAHLPQRAHAADAEDDFLLDARFAIAAVEPRRQLAIPGRVLREIGVEQQQPDAAETHAPHRRQHGAVTERHGDHARPAIGRDRGFDRRIGPADALVAFFLPAVVGHALAEVALRIHEADADERQAEVRGFLAVIAGEHAEAARVDRQRLVQRELRGEVGDAAVAEHRLLFAPPRVRLGPRLIEAEDRLVVGLDELRIRGRGGWRRSAVIRCSICTGLCAVARHSV